MHYRFINLIFVYINLCLGLGRRGRVSVGTTLPEMMEKLSDVIQRYMTDPPELQHVNDMDSFFWSNVR